MANRSTPIPPAARNTAVVVVDNILNRLEMQPNPQFSPGRLAKDYATFFDNDATWNTKELSQPFIARRSSRRDKEQYIFQSFFGGFWHHA